MDNNEARYIAASTEYATTARKTGTAYIFWIFTGVFGGHQFYLGKTGRAIAYLFTLGFLTIGVWIDMVTMSGQVKKRNAELERETFARHGLPAPGTALAPLPSPAPTTDQAPSED